MNGLYIAAFSAGAAFGATVRPAMDTHYATNVETQTRVVKSCDVAVDAFNAVDTLAAHALDESSLDPKTRLSRSKKRLKMVLSSMGGIILQWRGWKSLMNQPFRGSLKNALDELKTVKPMDNSIKELSIILITLETIKTQVNKCIEKILDAAPTNEIECEITQDILNLTREIDDAIALAK